MAERIRKKEELSVSTASSSSAATSSSSSSAPKLMTTRQKTTTIEVVPYFPPDVEVVMESPRNWDELPPRPQQLYDHPGPDDDNCYHIESVVARARVKIDGLYRLRFLVRWKGWEDAHNTWESAGELEGSEQYWLFNNPGKQLSCGAGPVERVHRFGSLPLPVYGVGPFSRSLQDLLNVYIEEGTYERIYGFNGIGNGYVLFPKKGEYLIIIK